MAPARGPEQAAPATGAEADELVDLYQEVATHLSVIRSSAPDPAVITYLSALLARARTRADRHAHDRAGAASPTSSPAASRPRSTAPGAGGWPAMLAPLRRGRGDDLVAARSTRRWSRPCSTRSEVDQLVNNDFASYYHESAASHFAAQVWTNNAWVAALCIAFGVLGLPVSTCCSRTSEPRGDRRRS